MQKKSFTIADPNHPQNLFDAYFPDDEEQIPLGDLKIDDEQKIPPSDFQIDVKLLKRVSTKVLEQLQLRHAFHKDRLKKLKTMPAQKKEARATKIMMIKLRSAIKNVTVEHARDQSTDEYISFSPGDDELFPDDDDAEDDNEEKVPPGDFQIDVKLLQRDPTKVLKELQLRHDFHKDRLEKLTNMRNQEEEVHKTKMMITTLRNVISRNALQNANGDVDASEDDEDASEDDVAASEDDVAASEDDVAASEDDVAASEDDVDDGPEDVDVPKNAVTTKADVDAAADTPQGKKPNGRKPAKKVLKKASLLPFKRIKTLIRFVVEDENGGEMADDEYKYKVGKTFVVELNRRFYEFIYAVMSNMRTVHHANDADCKQLTITNEDMELAINLVCPNLLVETETNAHIFEKGRDTRLLVHKNVRDAMKMIIADQRVKANAVETLKTALFHRTYQVLYTLTQQLNRSNRVVFKACPSFITGKVNRNKGRKQGPQPLPSGLVALVNQQQSRAATFDMNPLSDDANAYDSSSSSDSYSNSESDSDSESESDFQFTLSGDNRNTNNNDELFSSNSEKMTPKKTIINKNHMDETSFSFDDYSSESSSNSSSDDGANELDTMHL